MNHLHPSPDVIVSNIIYEIDIWNDWNFVLIEIKWGTSLMKDVRFEKKFKTKSLRPNFLVGRGGHGELRFRILECLDSNPSSRLFLKMGHLVFWWLKLWSYFQSIFLWIWILYWKYKILNKKFIYDLNRTHFLNMITKIAPIHLDNIVKTLSKIGGEIFFFSKYFLFWMIVTNYQILGISRVSTNLIKINFFLISKS